MEHRNIRLPKDLLDHVEKVAQEDFEGNFSMAIRYCLQLAKNVHDDLESLRQKLEVKG